MQIKVYLAKGLDHLQPTDAAAFARKYPSAIDGPTIRLSLPEEDPVLKGVHAELLRLGFVELGTPGADTSRKRFEYTRYRLYEDSDLATCELLRVAPKHQVRMDHQFQVGFGLRKSSVPALDVDAAAAGTSPVLVPQRVREVLERGDFVGAVFEPLRLFKVKSSQHDTFTELPWPIASRRWWILASSIMMPPCSDYLKVVGPNHTFHPRGSRNGRLVEEGFSDVERHYLRSELNALGSFDVAQEWESGGLREVIVSKRFYRYCRDQNLDIGFVPVRIDED